MESGRIGQILLKWKAITEKDLVRALDLQKIKKKRLGEILIEDGALSEKELVETLAKEFRLPFVDLAKEEVDNRQFGLFPYHLLKKLQLLPFHKKDGYILVATNDPLNIQSLQELSLFSGCSVRPVLATKEQITVYLEKLSPPMQETASVIKEIITEKHDDLPELDNLSLHELEAATQEASVVKLVNSVISEAIRQKASDIHFEPRTKGIFIRFRIDGVLYDKISIPPALKPAVISRVKIISGMDIAERRKPQDGRMSVSLGEDRIFDIRASTLPGIFGEKIVLRLLDKSSVLISLDSLGLEKGEQKLIDRLIKYPHGIILVTGPTGSGKTTTLYSILSVLNNPERNIVTVEDPVEYKLEGINQTSINVRAGYTFASAIRHILRQDPNIIMVGEIRDLETAEIAIQAALTGHLVLSTLHTNNAAGAITRLLDMNVEPFLISSALIGVIAQRLVRKLCPICKKEYTATDDLKEEISDLIPAEAKQLYFAEPVGCDECMHLGYIGRTGIFEVLTMDDRLRDLILKKSNEAEITKAVVETGMQTLRVSGVKKAIAKVTSLEEVMRVVFINKI